MPSQGGGDDGGIQGFLRSIPFDEIKHYYKQAVNCGIVDVVLHPFDYVDLLIRLGYEPFPPVEQSRLFHGKALLLPGSLSYVTYLYTIDGFNGVFRGVVPYVVGSLIYRHLSTYIVSRSPFALDHPQSEPRLCVQFTGSNISHFARTKCWILMSNVVALHAAYPFQVIAVRTMARFVTAAATNEGYRPEIPASWIDEIGRINGFDELFAGCQARVIREVTFALIAAGSFLAIMKLAQLVKADPQQADSLERSVEYIGNSIATMYTNPFRNVSDIMIINSTDIPLGNPPFNDIYASCFECIIKLRTDRKWKTSTSAGIFQEGRYYHGPIDILNGRLIPRGTFFGPVYFPVNAHGLEDLPYLLRNYYKAWEEMGGSHQAGRYGVVNSFSKREDTFRGGRGGDSVSYSEMRTLHSERVPVDILPLSKPLYFYGTSSNPFGL